STANEARTAGEPVRASLKRIVGVTALGSPPHALLAIRSLPAGRSFPAQLIQLLASPVLLHDDVLGLERVLQHIDRQVRLGSPAHEHVERRVVGLGPAMDADVALR